MTLLLAIDQGTSSTRALLVDRAGAIVASAQRALPQLYPQPGWVAHDPEQIWDDTVHVVRAALAQSGRPAGEIAAIGVANQRETTVLWDRATGRAIANAIVWQDRRTAAQCRRISAAGHDETVRRLTGLVIDPYFAATKIAWLLDHVPGARRAAEAGDLAFGTIDSFLLWRLTGGRVHATDATNAARTLLFDIHRQEWCAALLTLFDVPRALLPEVRDSAAAFGATDPALFGATIPIGALVGDQQAAAIGQGCVAPGQVKATYGTGCFILSNTGDRPVESRHRLLTTVAYRLGGRPSYALEGSIFIAGAALQWLRDALGLIDSAEQSAALAAAVPDAGGVYMVPAFTGLGAPHWDAEARGALIGLTRDTGRAQLVRAALEAACYQTDDLLQAMLEDGVAPPAALRIDGGMANNDWLAQFLADLLDLPVERPAATETTALGAAALAGLQAGWFAAPAEIAARWRCDRRFVPALAADRRAELRSGWRRAVAATRRAARPANHPDEDAPNGSAPNSSAPDRDAAERRS